MTEERYETKDRDVWTVIVDRETRTDVAICEDPEQAERIVRLLNADVVRIEKQGVKVP